MKFRYLAIEGNIGAGKTTFAEFLSQTYGFRLMTERFENNPFLADFYKDKDKFAYATEMFFLNDRKKHLDDFFENSNLPVISDFTIDKSAIFAGLNLSAEDFKKFVLEFDEIKKSTFRPDLIIHLKNDSEKKLDRIQKRGRDFEQKIKEDYLENLENAYLNYWNSQSELPVLILDLTGLRFPYSEIQIKKIAELINSDSFTGVKHLNYKGIF